MTAAEAQQFRLEIEGGRVTLDARDVSVPQVLAEWEKVGGTRVVGGEKIPSTRVTLILAGVREPEALQTLLRDVAAYIATPRKLVATGASGFDTLLILASSGRLSGDAAPAANADNTAGAVSSASLVTAVTPRGSHAPSSDEGFVYGNTVPTPPAGVAHSALVFPLLPAGSEVDRPVVGETGRRAAPGMVPVAIPPPTAAPAPRNVPAGIGLPVPGVVVRTPRP